MLVLVPAAAGLDGAAEKAGLTEALGGFEKEVELTVLEGVVTLDRLSGALVDDRYHVLHFVGHGGFRDERPFVVLNDASGAPAFVSHRELSSLLAGHPTLKLVVLNSCRGAMVSSSQPLVGMAAELVKQGLPAVVAMQYPIYDRQAVLFAREFYRCLFRGWARGWIEVAISLARRRLEAEFPGDRVVATPVLYTRAPEGVLFDLVSGSLLRDAPFSPKRLSALQALARAHERDRDVFAGSDAGGPGAAEAVRALDEIRRRIRFRNVSLAVAAGVALLTFFLSWAYAFDRLPAELKVESYTVWMAEGFIHRTLDDRLALVVLENDPRDRLVAPEPGAKRREYARLIDALSARGAAVVAFDLFFEKETPADGELAASIRRARDRGTAVVLGLPNVPRPAPPAALREAGAQWACLCAGRRGTKSAALVPLLAEAPGSAAAPVPALALAAMASLGGGEALDIDVERARINVLDRRGRRLVPVEASWVDAGRSTLGCATIGADDLVALLVVDAMPVAALREAGRRLTSRDLLASGASTAAPDMAGKAVLVGAADEADVFEVLRGLVRERRYGFEVHADALNTLLRRVAIRPLAAGAQLAVALALAVLAALLRSPALEARALARRGLLAGALLAYLGAGVYAYAAARLMVNTVYHVAALLLTYALLGRLRRQWWP
jgi:CHASE2 domain-containing sensor protein